MNAVSVFCLLLTITSVYSYSSYIHNRNLRSIPETSSNLLDVKLSDNEIKIDPINEESRETIRRKKSTKKDQLTLEDLKEITSTSNNEESNNKIDENFEKKLEVRSSQTTLNDVENKLLTKEDLNSDEKEETDRVRRQHVIMANPVMSGGDTMLIMGRPNYAQNIEVSHPHTRSFTGHPLLNKKIGIGFESGASLPVLQTHEAVATIPTIQAQPALHAAFASVPTKIIKEPIVSHLPVQTHLAPQVTQQQFYASVLPSHQAYACLCPCNPYGFSSGFHQPGFRNAVANSGLLNQGEGFYQVDQGSVFNHGYAKSALNLGDDQVQYIYQGPQLNVNSLKFRQAEQQREVKPPKPECNIDYLSSLHLDKSVMEGLLAHEERKLQKIEECAKSNYLNSMEYAMLVNMVNNEISLLQNEVKNMQQVQKQQQKPSVSPQIQQSHQLH